VPNPNDVDISQIRSGKWVVYAIAILFQRFWELAKVCGDTRVQGPRLTLLQKADSLDIVLILAGYLLMHFTFYLLIKRSRQLGSSFWLPLAIVSSAVLALLISLPIAMALKIPIDPVALTEALPFLVCTVGFDKPVRLARAVFTHPHLLLPMAETPATNGLSAPASTPSSLKPAPKIITESLSLVYPPIIRDYFLEIAVLAVGASSKVGGLREVCALAALLLGVDCLLLCTYFSAILGVMIEVSRPFSCLFSFLFLSLFFCVCLYGCRTRIRARHVTSWSYCGDAQARCLLTANWALLFARPAAVHSFVTS